MHSSASVRHKHDIDREIDPFVHPSANRDHRIWIHRNVSQQAQIEIGMLADKIMPSEASRKITAFTVTLIRTEDINHVIEQTCLRTLLVQDYIARVLRTKYPDTFSRPVTASVAGISQYGKKIALDINYPELKEEFNTISKVMHQHFNTEDEWRIDTHISIATGKVVDLSNISEIQRSLPSTIDLTPVRTSIYPVGSEQ